MKDLYNRLDLKTGLWWMFLIIMFLVVPLYKVSTIHIECNEKVLEIVWWMYMLGVFVYDWFLIILAISLSMIGMLMTKIHNLLTKDNK